VLLGALLVIIIVYVVREGASAVSWHFLFRLPRPAGMAGGGMGNGIAGSAIMVGMGSIIALPMGIVCGIYLSEFGLGKFPSVLRFLIEVMNGLPTIVFALLAYALVVVPMSTASAYAGAVALAMVMLPLSARATEVALRQVPHSWKEASLALGASPARTMFSVILPGARAGVITGAVLTIARAAGETAPLLFTALGNDVDWPTHLGRPTAALPLQVFEYASSPYPNQNAQAWAAAMVLVVGILLLNMTVRFFARSAVVDAGRM
jgi:phosphate transport system permease protein